MQVYCIGLYSRFHFQSQFPPPPPQTWLTVTAESHLHLSDQCIGCVKLILFVVQLLGIEIEIVSKKDLKWDTLEFFLWSRRFIRSRSQSRRRVKITLFFVIPWSFGVTVFPPNSRSEYKAWRRATRNPGETRTGFPPWSRGLTFDINKLCDWLLPPHVVLIVKGNSSKQTEEPW